jgi:hypothetical protein
MYKDADRFAGLFQVLFIYHTAIVFRSELAFYKLNQLLFVIKVHLFLDDADHAFTQLFSAVAASAYFCTYFCFDSILVKKEIKIMIAARYLAEPFFCQCLCKVTRLDRHYCHLCTE